jgi:hypothetical protein
MGIAVEFCPDLALRSFGTSGRKVEECLPQPMIKGKVYNFLKEGQRNYWMLGELPLRETKGNSILSRPLASVRFIEVTHFASGEKIWTKGTYEIVEVYDVNDDAVHFDGLEKIK